MHIETTMKSDATTDQHPDTTPIDGALAFSIDGFCRASSLGRSYTYEAIADGRLKTVMHGKRRLILRADAEAFLRGEGTP
jgi:excisionase family DNA binding protein